MQRNVFTVHADNAFGNAYPVTAGVAYHYGGIAHVVTVRKRDFLNVGIYRLNRARFGAYKRDIILFRTADVLALYAIIAVAYRLVTAVDLFSEGGRAFAAVKVDNYLTRDILLRRAAFGIREIVGIGVCRIYHMVVCDKVSVIVVYLIADRRPGIKRRGIGRSYTSGTPRRIGFVKFGVDGCHGAQNGGYRRGVVRAHSNVHIFIYEFPVSDGLVAG